VCSARDNPMEKFGITHGFSTFGTIGFKGRFDGAARLGHLSAAASAFKVALANSSIKWAATFQFSVARTD
jgi:hypothetical protein